jgi:DNA replication protein DnaC
MKEENDIVELLSYLKLPFVRENHKAVARTAAERQWSHIEYLAELVRGEAGMRRDGAVKRRIASARFPVVKTLEQFDWLWPKKINRLQIQNLFHLNFVPEKANVVFVGGVGLGKTHLATALGYHACLRGHSVLFTSAVDAVNDLSLAQKTGQLKQGLKKYLKPSVLILDELGYLPIDKTGADLLFQTIGQRYERGTLIITTNRVFKEWPKIFNNDSTLTSALLDRLLHHTEVVLIEGSSYRMKDIVN